MPLKEENMTFDTSLVIDLFGQTSGQPIVINKFRNIRASWKVYCNQRKETFALSVLSTFFKVQRLYLIFVFFRNMNIEAAIHTNCCAFYSNNYSTYCHCHSCFFFILVCLVAKCVRRCSLAVIAWNIQINIFLCLCLAT